MISRRLRAAILAGVAGGLMIVGPTASGKTALAHQVVRTVGGAVVVGIDAMTVYRGMEVGTAMPSREERSAFGYRLVAHVDPASPYSLGQYLHDLEETLAALGRERLRPVFAGGTALWVEAVANGMSVPPSYPGLRRWLEATISGEGEAAAGYRLLAAVDAKAAAGIDPRNRRRLVRALEVALGSAGARSVSGGELGSDRPARYPMLGIRIPRERLRERIRSRIAVQLRSGWIEEAARLDREALSRTAREAIGYAEIWDYLGGGVSCEEAAARIERRTYRLAKRQLAWLERDPRILWVENEEEGLIRAKELLGEDAPV